MTSFDDKVAIVTGTSLGVGIACDLTVAGASRRAEWRRWPSAIHMASTTSFVPSFDQLTMQLESRVRSDASSWGCHRCR